MSFFPLHERELIANIQTAYDDTGVTEEERLAFMNGMETDKPDDIKRGGDED